MAFLMSAVPHGFGSGMLASFMRGGLGQVALKGAVAPTFSSAFIYGASCCLAGRAIEYIGKEVCDRYQLGEKETLILTVGVIALKMLSAYQVSERLGPVFDIEVPTNYIHFENALYLASILEVDFDMTVNRVNNRIWTSAADNRLHTQAYGFVQMINEQLIGPLMRGELH